MPTQKYKLANGKVVPGVTTIIGASLGWNKRQLMHWAWQQGMEGIDYNKSSQAAMDAGTIAHAMAESSIKGTIWERPVGIDNDTFSKARTAFEAFQTWQSMSKIELLESETPFVSERLRFGGTLDAIARINSEIALIDFKTSNGLYEDHVVQISAYLHLYEEVKQVEIKGGVHILRFGKNAGNFHHHYYPRKQMDDPFRVFVNLRELYDLKKTLESMT
jgi:hypothetical protein